MRSRTSNHLDEGSVLSLVFILVMGLALTLGFVLQLGQVEAQNSRVQMASVRALYDAWGELEKAQRIIADSAYSVAGRNLVIQDALAEPDQMIPGTRVVVDRMTNVDGTWYSMTARVPYEGNYERVVMAPVREVDYFSSYNLFVSEHPAGISGSPIGAIHSNKNLQFYFPNGNYQHSLTAVDGVEYRGGATVDNTSVTGPFNPSSEAINLDLSADDRTNINHIADQSDTEFHFEETIDVALRFHVEDGAQWVEIEKWSQPEVNEITEEVIVSYDEINPREETYTYIESVSAGMDPRTREIEVFDHYETVMVDREVPVYVEDTRMNDVPVYVEDTRMKDVPVYVEDTRMKDVPVYVDEVRTREVPVYVDETRYRTETQTVWVTLDGESGGTTVGGDGSVPGYWAEQEVEVSYTVQVLDHMDTEEYTVSVFDHYEQVPETYWRFDHYDQVPETYMRLDHYEQVPETYMRFDHYDIVQDPVEEPRYRTEIEEYEVELFEDVEREGTRTVYDTVPVYETQTHTEYVESVRLSTEDRLAPDNGLIFAEGSIRGLAGDVVGRLTVGTRNSMVITDNLVYRDVDGDPAYVNGLKPWLSYEPNASYDARAALGLIAQRDVLYGRDLPANFEINASMLAVTGRVGIEGLTLDSDGNVSGYNELFDEFGRTTGDSFAKNSIRRLGGITTAQRPVETVLDNGTIAAGFNVGTAVFDIGMLDGPPPFFLTYPSPRFFASSIVK